MRLWVRQTHNGTVTDERRLETPAEFATATDYLTAKLSSHLAKGWVVVGNTATKARHGLICVREFWLAL